MDDIYPCSGCYIYMEDLSCDITSIFIDKLTDSDMCPCSICLVKVVCEGTCEDYLIFYRDLSVRPSREKASEA